MRTACEWRGHEDAMNEAGWCPCCDLGDLDPEFAKRNEMESEPSVERASK